MAQYDGSIRIDTKIDTKNATSQMMTLENRIVKTADRIASLRQKMESLKNTKIPTQEYTEVQKQIENTEKKLAALTERQEKYLATGGKESSSVYKKMVYDAEQLENTLKYTQGELQELVDTGKAFTLRSDTQEYGNLKQQLGYLENEYSVLIQRRNEFEQRHGIQPDGYERLKASLLELQGSINRVLHPIEAMKSSFSSAAEKMKAMAAGVAASIINGIAHPLQTIKSVSIGAIGGISKMVSGIVSSFRNARNVILKAASAMSLFGKNTKNTNSMLNGGLKSILKYGLGIRSLYALISRFRAAVKEGFGNLAQYSAPVNTALSSLKSSLTQLKNSLATAFAPILTAIAPALTTLINLASRAATAVGMLIAALTGQSTFTKATAVQEDYAKSLGGTAKAAKNANKQLSSLDKLNNLTTQDSGGGGGGGGGAGVGDMFETVEIPSKFADLANMIKDAWANADFTEVGAMIGMKLKEGLDSIDWNPIKETAAKIGKSLATLINGFVEVEGLADSIGRTIGEMINTGIAGINAFLDNTHWDSVGKFIGDGLNGIVNTIDWEGLGHLFAAKFNAIFETIGNAALTFDWKNFGNNLATSLNKFIEDFNWEENGANLGELAKGILDTIITFLENTDWQKIGNEVARFIGGIDWSGITSRLFEGIGAAIGGLAAFLWGLIEEAWNDVVGWWKDTAYEDGSFTIEGLFLGILEALGNIGMWIREHIFQPFIDGFKKAFGINSPSKVLAEQGGYIISGLLKGLKDNISSVLDWLKNIPTWFKEKFDLAYKNAKNAFSGAKSYFSGIWNNIKAVFSNISSWFKDKFTAAWTAVKNVFSKGGKIFDGIKDGILNGLKAVVNAIIGGINKVIAVPFKGLNTALGKLKSVDIMGIKPFGFIQTISVPQIPKLATGAVIPANKEFLAVLGDQKHGRNLEAPEDLIRQIVREETAKNNNSGGEITIRVPLYIDGKQVTEAVVKADREHFNSTGRPLFSF